MILIGLSNTIVLLYKINFQCLSEAHLFTIVLFIVLLEYDH